MGNVTIGGKTGSLDMDNYCFIDFKPEKIKNYIIPRDENKILIINQDPKFWESMERLADSLIKEGGLDVNCKKKDSDIPLVTEKNKNVKPPKPDTVYIVSCTEIKQAENSLSYTGFQPKPVKLNGIQEKRILQQSQTILLFLSHYKILKCIFAEIL